MSITYIPRPVSYISGSWYIDIDGNCIVLFGKGGVIQYSTIHHPYGKMFTKVTVTGILDEDNTLYDIVGDPDIGYTVSMHESTKGWRVYDHAVTEDGKTEFIIGDGSDSGSRVVYVKGNNPYDVYTNPNGAVQDAMNNLDTFTKIDIGEYRRAIGIACNGPLLGVITEDI
jgi:hypothetical protein